MSSKNTKSEALFPHQLDPSNHRVKIDVHGRIYPLEAVMGAAYTFIDRAYVYLEGTPRDHVTVHLRPKNGSLDPAGAETLAGQFQNELLNAALRLRVARRNQKLQEYIVSQALYGANPQAADEAIDQELKDILREAEEESGADDPRGITLSWEEKYGKGKTKAKSDADPNQV